MAALSKNLRIYLFWIFFIATNIWSYLNMPELQYYTIVFFRTLEQHLIYTHNMMEQLTSFLVTSDGVVTHLEQVPKTQLGGGSLFTKLIDLNDDSVFVGQSEDTVCLEDRQDYHDHRRLVLAIKVLSMSIGNTISLFVSSFYI